MLTCRFANSADPSSGRPSWVLQNVISFLISAVSTATDNPGMGTIVAAADAEATIQIFPLRTFTFLFNILVDRLFRILLRNYTILSEDDSTKVTFEKPPLKAFRRAKNLNGLLVNSSLPQVLQRQIGTFPCNRSDCRTYPFINSSDRITTTQGQIKISGFFTCITSQLVYCVSCRKCPGVVNIGETGRRLGDRFREHRLDVIKKKVALSNIQYECLSTVSNI